MTETTLSLNDLPRFSAWPARLLGLQSWTTNFKTRSEIDREYEREKWGPLLARARAADGPVSLDRVEKWNLEAAPSSLLVHLDDEWTVVSPSRAREIYLNLVESITRPYLPAPAFVELGCGYGSVILDLARRGLFQNARLLAGEYTRAGVELTRLLATVEEVTVEVGMCDFNSSDIADFEIPEGAVILTSFAAHYVPMLAQPFVETIARWRPSVVIHLEPCYEHCDQSLLGLMRRRYIEVNDYNRNLLTLLQECQKAGIVKLLDERASLFGSNVLLPPSLLAWKPVC